MTYHGGFERESCICGNTLVRCQIEPSFRVRRSPCRCKKPGDGPRQGPCRDLRVSEKQYNQRKAAGLPVEADVEKGLRTRWH